jgi:hypothetical protein
VEAIPVIDIFDRPTQASLALPLDTLYTNPTLAVAQLRQFFGPTATISVVPNSSSVFPGSLIVVTPRQTVVLLSGTTTYQQAALQVLYLTLGISPMSGFSTIDLWWNAASEISNRIAAAGADMTKPLTLVGHSYGGAVASILTGRIVYGGTGIDVRLLTFGSPRPGDQRLQGLLDNVPRVHFANVGDLIPGMPPDGDELLPFVLFVPLIFLIRWRAIARYSTQWQLSRTGSIIETTRSTATFAATFDVVNDVILGVPIAAISEHSMAEYYRRLRIGAVEIGFASGFDLRCFNVSPILGRPAFEFDGRAGAEGGASSRVGFIFAGRAGAEGGASSRVAIGVDGRAGAEGGA